jgi:hypothetical protein
MRILQMRKTHFAWIRAGLMVARLVRECALALFVLQALFGQLR